MVMTRREFMMTTAAALLTRPASASGSAVSIGLTPSNLGLSFRHL